MHRSPLFRSIVGLLVVVSALATPALGIRNPRGEPSLEFDDDRSRLALIGEWNCRFRQGDFSLDSRIVFRADGSFSETGAVASPEINTEFTGAGTWEVEYGHLIYNLTQSSVPNSPERAEMQLIELASDRIRYLSIETGLVFELIRATPL